MGAKVDRRCGFGSLKKVAGLQRCASLALYSLVTGFIILGITASYSYMSGVQSTSQTVFSFNSKDIGIWYASFEVGSVLSNVLASYFLTNKHIPNVLAIGLSMVIMGCFMHGLPHFFIDYADKTKDTGDDVSAADYIKTYLCSVTENPFNGTNFTTELVTKGAPLIETGSSLYTLSIVIYCIGGFLMGAGYAPFWCLGLVYIDDNVRNVHDTTKYVAVILAFYTVGPVIGFGAAGLFLSFYVTLGQTYLTEDDAQWIGAYWIGYVMFAVYLVVLMPLIFMFPKRLPQQVENSANINAKKISTNSTSSQKELTSSEYIDGLDDGNLDGDDENVRDNVRSIKDLGPTMLRLFTNPLYMLEVLGSCTGVYYISGWIGFLPKYFEVQFYLSASLSSIYAGALPPLLSSVAVFIGGYLSSKYKMTTQQNAKLLFITSVVSAGLLVPMFFLTCEQFPVQEPSANLTCVPACMCKEDDYVPVCHEGVTYKSPCVVGCLSHEEIGEEIHYKECLCEKNVTMTDGVCKEESCPAPYIYMVCAILSMASFISCSSAGVNIIMRSVAEEDKSLALGVQSSLNSLLAWIPAPILYGVLIDSTCSIWEYSEDPWGYCMEYYNPDFTNKYLGLTMGTLGFTCIFLGIAIPVSYMDRYIDVKHEGDNNEFGNGAVSNPNDVKLDNI